jgi:hypothetical protein
MWLRYSVGTIDFLCVNFKKTNSLRFKVDNSHSIIFGYVQCLVLLIFHCLIHRSFSTARTFIDQPS